MLWALDDARADGLALDYPYFETAEPLVRRGAGTYVETDVGSRTTAPFWNHGLGEIVTALLDAGSRSPGSWSTAACRGTRCPADGARRRRRVGLADHPERLPLTYTLQARKP